MHCGEIIIIITHFMAVYACLSYWPQRAVYETDEKKMNRIDRV